MFIYYVYAYINKKTGLPYYIGKGKGRRAYMPHGRVKLPKDKSKIVFLETNLSNVGACALERRYISWFGRKGIDEGGILLNITEGGEGSSKPGHLNGMFGKKRPDLSVRNKLGQTKQAIQKLKQYTGEKASGYKSVWSNNGIEEVFDKIIPPNFIKGRLPRIWWNDGVEEILSTKQPHPTFKKGRLPGQKRTRKVTFS